MAEEKTEVEKARLSDKHPEVFESYERLNALFFEMRALRREGREIPKTLLQEAGSLVSWAQRLAEEVFGDQVAAKAQIERDEAAFAAALRLKDDAMLVRQVLAAADEVSQFVRTFTGGKE